jgi:hypothetical protein
VVIRPQRAGTGWLHRLSFLSPAGLADGLALKELRYAIAGDSPQACRPSVPPRPFSPGLRLGWTAALYQHSASFGQKKRRNYAQITTFQS